MSNSLKYDSYGNLIEGTNYCSGVETFAQNLIEDNENDASITFPSPGGWTSSRTEDYILTDNNACIILPSDIYKLTSVKIRATYYSENGNLKDLGWIYPNGATRSILFSEFKNSNGESLEYIDITDYVVNITMYNTLKVIKNADSVHSATINKGNTLCYEKNKIILTGGRMGFINDLINGNYINWQKAIQSALAYKTDKEYFCESDAGDHVWYLESAKDGCYFGTDDPRSIQVRVSYIPMTSDLKLRARKSAKTNVNYIQPMNQRAEINSASAFGKLLHSTAQKTGTEQITLVKWYTKLNDIPPLGCRVKHNNEHYILTANSFEMTNTVHIKVTHTLSKNWSNKSQYVSVDQKYRNYNIPADILWRNLYWEDFIEVTADGVVEGAEVGSLISSGIQDGQTIIPVLPRIFMCDTANDVTITSFFLFMLGEGVTTPCTTMGIANSMVFSASMKDNLSAGLRVYTDTNYCEDVFYCNNDGTLKRGNIVLSSDVVLNSLDTYPHATRNAENRPLDFILDETYEIDKDPGEALKFTYQCHWISSDNDIVIGNKLAENHPLVKKWTESRKFKFWRLSKKLRQGEDKIYASEGEDNARSITNDASVRIFYWELSDYAGADNTKAFRLKLTNLSTSWIANYRAWAITDENNNLYIGCNDISKTALYFTHIHKRK